MNIPKYIVKSVGVVGECVSNSSDENPKFIKSFFFKPYTSPANFFSKSASVVIAPIIYSAVVAGFILMAAYELLKTIGNVVGLLDSTCLELSPKLLLCAACLAALLAIASPFINFVDLVGSAVTSINEVVTNMTENDGFCRQNF